MGNEKKRKCETARRDVRLNSPKIAAVPSSKKSLFMYPRI